MKLYRITACTYADDLSGEGAFLYGGRWNSKGTRLLYTSENPSLAYLEALAHMTMVNQQRAYCKMTLEWNTKEFRNDPTLSLPKKWFLEIPPEKLPLNWRASPAPYELKKIGDDFVREGRFLALKIPSVIEPDNFNYLWSPAHPKFGHLTMIQTQRISLDQRLFSK